MIKRRTCQLELPSGALTLGQRTLLMGVLNVTPDSFSDGGKFLDAQRAIGRALEMERAGADLLDIGGPTHPRGFRRPGRVAETLPPSAVADRRARRTQSCSPIDTREQRATSTPSPPYRPP